MQQQTFDFKAHGGKRRGAGRKKAKPSESSHEIRPEINANLPLGITIKLLPGLESLRSPHYLKAIGRALQRARNHGLRVAHYSVQRDHIHFIAEADDKEALERGMRSITVSIANAMNRERVFTGPVFKGRYHLHPLETPTEVRNAIKYVYLNFAKHSKAAPCADPYSTIFYYWELHELIGESAAKEAKRLPHWSKFLLNALSAPRSWLLREGWRRGRK